jgi:hypothetical protein
MPENPYCKVKQGIEKLGLVGKVGMGVVTVAMCAMMLIATFSASISAGIIFSVVIASMGVYFVVGDLCEKWEKEHPVA